MYNINVYKYECMCVYMCVCMNIHSVRIYIYIFLLRIWGFSKPIRISGDYSITFNNPDFVITEICVRSRITLFPKREIISSRWYTNFQV